MPSKHNYYALFKPYGYISQFITNDVHAKRKKFLGELYNFPEATMAVGRLDEPSEGLLLLTTNGKFSYQITNGNIEKEYYAQLDGEITSEALQKLQKGIEISVEGKNYTTRSCKVALINQTPALPLRAKKIRDDRHGATSWISITLTEGKFRQVRKMTAAVGFPTLRLVRVRIGPYQINTMQAGEVIVINPDLIKGIE